MSWQVCLHMQLAAIVTNPPIENHFCQKSTVTVRSLSGPVVLRHNLSVILPYIRFLN